ncbi:toll-like receptor 4 isoform X2 [Argopecten irradians]|uniref:toll-like receptor 4 isoform X2 n=1 Tax=Argopecten irradians TaxID=31199 RepID=UPI003722CE02
MADVMIVFVLCTLLIVVSSDALPVCCDIVEMPRETRVICSGCRLHVVPKDLPSNTTVLDLSINYLISLEQDSFPDLPLLKILYLQRNNLVRIKSGAFDNVPNIEELDLTDNILEEVSIDTNVFKTLKKLKSLNIQRNNFHISKGYPGQALSTISTLEFLAIDIFEGFMFGKRFWNQTNLLKLYLSFRGKGGIALLNTSFDGVKRSNIKELNIIAPFRKIENNFLSPFVHLTTLIMINKSNKFSIHDALQGLYGIRERTMDLLTMRGFRYKYTNGEELGKSDMFNLGTICVRTLHLIGNAISIMGTDAVAAWTTKTCIEDLDLSENMFYLPQTFPLLALFRSLTYFRATHTQIRIDRKRRSFNNEQILYLPRNLTLFDMSYNALSGPLFNVTIANDNLNVLNIGYSSKNPKCSYAVIKGLVHLKELDISGVDCSQVHPNMFLEMPNLSRLTARKCNIEHVLRQNTPAIFKELYNLSSVDVSLNKLYILNSQLFAYQTNSLKYLNLSENYMDQIPTQVLYNLSVLENLDVSNNFIATLNYSQYSFLEEMKKKSKKFQIVLHGNPLVCICENLEFLSWVEATNVIYKKRELLCMTSEGIQVPIVELLETFDLFKDHCVSQTWLIVSVTLTVIFFVLGILAREAWRRSVSLRVMCRHPVESTKYTNDIYISYCDKDYSWVRNTLAPWLDEKQIEYCCEDKTFILGEDIADNIMDAIDSSRQTVFVVSYASLEREWTTFTMRLTCEYSFRVGRENMNIFILLDDIKKSEFPKLIRHYWKSIHPLRWPKECNINLERTDCARNKFWDGLSRRIPRRKSDLKSPHVTETIL